MKTYFIKASELRDRFTAARRAGKTDSCLNGLVRPSCLIIDEIGHCAFDKESTRMFFDLIDRRYNLEYPTSDYEEEAWVKFVRDQGYISELREKLDQKFSENIPVFLTASCLLRALIKPDSSCSCNMTDYYLGASKFITPENSELKRTLIPLSRHREYSLEKHEGYLTRIQNYFY